MRPILIGLVVFATACAVHHGTGGDDDGSDSLDDLTGLEIAPQDQTLIIDNGTAATATYTVTGRFADGHTEDVTQRVSLVLADGTVGEIDAGVFTSVTTHGGATQVVASGGNQQIATGLTVQFKQSYNDPGSTGLPNDPSGLFNGTVTAARAPSLVYPNDNVLVPPNLGKLEFHFMPGTSNTVFALSLHNATTDITVYLQCSLPMNGGCIFLPDETLWGWLSNSNRGTGPVTWSIRGTDNNGTAVGASTEMHVSFVPEDVTGGMYYWTTTAEAIMRYDFGSQTQTVAEKYVGTELENTCIGCHALSRGGEKLVAEINGQNDGRTALVDVATKTVMNDFGNTPKTTFESWAADGSEYVGVYGDSGATNYNLMLLDGTTADLKQTIDVGGTAAHPTDHPDFASDGNHIAYVKVGTPGTLQRMWNGSIYQVVNTGGTWGSAMPLVTATNTMENNYYPSYAPDNRLLVFDRSHCTSGNAKGTECYADTNPDAQLYAVDSIAGGTPVNLTNVNRPGIADGATTKLTNTFPKWNPFIFPIDTQGGHVAWITFSSSRKFGLRNAPSGTLLWMAAIDLDAPAGSDASFVPFALPFQDLATSNHIAQWTTQIVPLQ
jgi:hypothetical protein